MDAFRRKLFRNKGKFVKIKMESHQAWCYMPKIPVLGQPKQEDHGLHREF
jgi:hypothetical protein